MQIKQQMLASHIQRQIAPLYLISGQDNYLLEDSINTIKSAIKKNYDCDEKIISIQGAEDWSRVKEEANSYSLFSETVLLTVFFDKKSIDAAGKKMLMDYLSSINSRCFILIRAPHVVIKQLQWLIAKEHAVVLMVNSLTPESMKSWIATQLRKNTFRFDEHIPELIHQYMQGNMLACAQLIEKLSLSCSPNQPLELQQVQEHLSDQCDHNLFELSDACLLGQGDKAIQIIRHAANNKTETTLILWILCQEIRLLLQLSFLMEQKVSFQNACNQIKIWSSRTRLYQMCCNRLTQSTLLQLHRYGITVDERIKSNLNTHVWNALESIALSLCLGRLIGELCIV